MTDKKLQMMINRTVAASNRFHASQRELNAYCEKRWGFAPSDRDADFIIDGVYGGCGHSDGMSAQTFIDEMEEKVGEPT